ncbi:uncharacterized protein CELE_Y75B8A.44 [Caenorhabditis elegans]|uniref:Secreted protein n=1 Tax=Caenorhabditis elegans TaxID=6239 RepID=D0Z5N3_CAEEL|nr:Secreted protein [Caenorhabditis elegans]CBI63246.1 Secreted protein [Caenorhabditis elegans]|eukprot:NP_001255161.1 Uncharacterized protein CELE_Y75B8A.44 [Caenorhabditis elegans]
MGGTILSPAPFCSTVLSAASLLILSQKTEEEMRGIVILLLIVVSLLLISTVHSHPFFIALTRLQDAEQLMSKRGLDKCGCNLGCFYSSARDCMSCCALAL